MAHRADLNSLSAPDRTTLVNLMLDYIDDAVVAGHMAIVHSGLQLFTGHRAYIAGMETWLAANGGSAFVPLPMWDPANSIPAELNVVKPQDDLTPRPPLGNLNPSLSLPPQFEYPAVCDFESGADLGNAFNGWHGSVHVTIGGSMGNITIASAAPIFWCWHAFVDHVYWNWQTCQLVCPDVVGDGLGWAKLRLCTAGLKVGNVTRLPRGLMRPDCVPSYPPRHCQPPPDYPVGAPCYLPGNRPPGSHHGDQGHGGAGHGDQGHGDQGHGDQGHGDQGHGGEPTGGAGDYPGGGSGHGGHGDPFRNPKPDYSHLTGGPVVLSQSPAAGMSVTSHVLVDLVVLDG